MTPAGVATTFATGFNFPFGLAFNATGDLFVANFLGNSIDKVTPDGIRSPFVTGLVNPEGIAFTSNGAMFATGLNNPRLIKARPLLAVAPEPGTLALLIPAFGVAAGIVARRRGK